MKIKLEKRVLGILLSASAAEEKEAEAELGSGM